MTFAILGPPVHAPGILDVMVEALALILAAACVIGWLAVRVKRETAARRRAEEDVVEGRNAASALRLSEERYALAIEATEAGHWDWIIPADRYYVSPQFLKMHGLHPDLKITNRSELVSRIHFHPEDRPKWETAIAEFFAGSGSRIELEVRVLRDRETRWMHAIGLLQRDASGAPVRWSGSAVDITERKRAEEALWQSEERFALAVAGSSDGVFDWDLVTDQMYMSDRAQEFFGVANGPSLRPRMQWMSLTGMLAEDVLDAAQALRAHLRGDTPIFVTEYRIEQPEGGWRWFRMRGTGLRNAAGRVYRMAGSLEEITQRKGAEEALQLSADRYALVMKASGAGHWDWDIEKDEFYASPRLCEIYGIPPGAKWRTREEFAAQTPSLGRERYSQAVADFFAGKTERFEIDIQGQVNGEPRWVRYTGTCIRDPTGKPVRWVGSAIDISERQRDAEALAKLEAQLREASRLESLGTLAGGIAHDFNNILASVLGYTEMALRDAPPRSRLRDDLESIAAAGERGRALVERVLAFSRSSARERIAVNVEKVVIESLNLLSASLPRNVKVKSSLSAGRAAMLGDPTQVHQIVMNLVTNAVQAMRSGGTVRVSFAVEAVAAPRTPTVGNLASGEYLVLRVADDGEGIPAKALSRIFDPFFTTKEVGVGTGLGLSLVHGIVANIGGAIDVATEVGKGSEFTVYLPRSGDAEESAQSEAAGAPRGNRERVLIVDDEEPLVRLTTRTLTELGYRPVGFTSSAAALEVFRADPARFDAVITDERMPGMSGVALIGELRAIRPGMPILLVSGHAGGTVVDRAYGAGADEVLSKPLASNELAAALARVLGTTDARNQRRL